MRKTRMCAAAAVSLAGAAVVVALTVSSLASAGDEHSLTAVAAAATARFHNLDAAKADGYTLEVADSAGLTCIADPAGGMGIHWASPSLLGDDVVDARRPEALVFAPNAAGQPKLAALEYIVFASAWTAAGHTDPPSLFGQPFALTPDNPPNRFGIPAFWSLHVWIWRPNQAGMFQPWNPRVHC